MIEYLNNNEKNIHDNCVNEKEHYFKLLNFEQLLSYIELKLDK